MSGTAVAESGILHFSYEGNITTNGYLVEIKAPVSGRVTYVTAAVVTASNEDGIYIAVEGADEWRKHDDTIYISDGAHFGTSTADSGSSHYKFERGDVLYLNVWGIAGGDQIAGLVVAVAYEGATEAVPVPIQPDNRFS